MNDDRLIRDLQALDRPISVDPEFADRLFARLREERRSRTRRLPFFLLAAALLIGGSVGAAAIGMGQPQPSEAPLAVVPVRQIWALPTRGRSIRLEYAIPMDLGLEASDGSTYLEFYPRGGFRYVPDGQTTALPVGARGVKIYNVVGATAHYSHGRPLGTDAASFIDGLGSHPILDAELGTVAETRLGDTPAVAADLLGISPGAHLDGDDLTIDLWPPSRLVVADVGGAIVLVQMWAATDDDLAQWLPDAERLVASFRFLDGG